MPVRYIDLFAGCGGISLGLHEAGLEGIFAVERSRDAFSTLRHNLIDAHKHFDWPKWLEIREWNINSLLGRHQDSLSALQGKVDIVVGGPPCQGFSFAGQRRASDNRNKLIHAYLRFVALVRPRVILFENVYGFTVRHSNLASRRNMAYSEIVIKQLRELGYSDAHGEIVDMSDYGVPQRRKRFIVIASREAVAGAIFEELKARRDDFLMARGLRRLSTVGDAISDLEVHRGEAPCPDSGDFQSGFSWAPQTALQAQLRLDVPGKYIPDSHRIVQHRAATSELFANLLNSAPRNKCISGSTDQVYGIRKRSLTVLDRNQPAPTITTIPDDFVHYAEPRVMTVRECARLQSFPDWFEFKGAYTTGGKRRLSSAPRYTQVGNAVPPLFAEQIGLAVMRVLSSKEGFAKRWLRHLGFLW